MGEEIKGQQQSIEKNNYNGLIDYVNISIYKRALCAVAPIRKENMNYKK